MKSQHCPRRSATTQKGLGGARWVQFSLAAKKIRQAHEAGCHIEALMLLESIVSDRIESRLHFLRGGGAVRMGSPHAMLSDWRRREHVSAFASLIAPIDDWRRQRNQAAHGMAKLAQLEEAGFLEKYAELGAAVEVGARLLLELAAVDARERECNRARKPATEPRALEPLRAIAAPTPGTRTRLSRSERPAGRTGYRDDSRAA